MTIHLDNVTVTFEDERVLSRFSLKVNSGEKVVVAGRSGSGKSTILHLILGFVRPDEGRVTMGDTLLTGKSIAMCRASVAWVPQFNTIGEGSVKEVIYHPFEFRNNQNKKPDRTRVETLLRELLLDPGILEKQYRDLSGGQQQRISILIALLMDKPLLLLDEPTTALDSQSKKAAMQLLLDNNRATVLSTSHDTTWLKACDKTIHLT